MSEIDKRQLNIIKIWCLENGKKILKPRKCNKCQDDNEDNFYTKNRTMCIKCIKEKKIKNKKSNIPIKERLKILQEM
jgi:hypothetical protein